jgi:hypothetical protein
MNQPRTTYVLDRDPRVAAAAERAISFLFHDAPHGSGWNGMPLAEFIESSHDRLCARLKELADPGAVVTIEDERALRSALDTLIEAKRVWQDMQAGQGSAA